MIAPTDPAFSFAEYRERVERVQALLAGRELDGLFLRNRADVCYLTGLENAYMTAFHAVFVPVVGEPTVFASDFEMLNAVADVWWSDRVTFSVGSDPLAVVAAAVLARGRGRQRVGVELATLPTADYQRLHAGLPEATLVAADDLMSAVKRRKSPAEIAYLRAAARLTTLGMEAALAAVRLGGTDNDVAAAGYQAMVAGGSEFPCIEPIVSAGRRAGIPHSSFRRTVLQSGDAVLIELGASVRRYSAPLFRTAALAPVPAEIAAAAQACWDGLDALRSALRPGAPAREAAAKARAAWSPFCDRLIWHGIYAYSVGLGFPPDWNDCPLCITEQADFILEPGMCFHATTSLREPGRYGAACSETVLITDSGPEVLTGTKPELVVR